MASERRTAGETSTAAKTSDASMQPRRYDAVARVVTEVFYPPWVVTALLGVVSATSTEGTWEFLVWWAVSAFFVCLLPLGFVLWLVRRGSVSGLHAATKKERIAPLTVAVASAGAAVLLTAVFSAPRPLVATALAVMAGLLVSLILTPKWKISGHAASITGAIVVLALLFGPWMLLLAPIVPVVGWARIRMDHHSLNQVIAGAAIGAAAAAVVYTGVLAVT